MLTSDWLDQPFCQKISKRNGSEVSGQGSERFFFSGRINLQHKYLTEEISNCLLRTFLFSETNFLTNLLYMKSHILRNKHSENGNMPLLHILI